MWPQKDRRRPSCLILDLTSELPRSHLCSSPSLALEGSCIWSSAKVIFSDLSPGWVSVPLRAEILFPRIVCWPIAAKEILCLPLRTLSPSAASLPLVSASGHLPRGCTPTLWAHLPSMLWAPFWLGFLCSPYRLRYFTKIMYLKSKGMCYADVSIDICALITLNLISKWFITFNSCFPEQHQGKGVYFMEL